MPCDVYAAPVPVPVERRDTMIGLRFNNAAEALERAAQLRRAGWFVYRIKGADGFTMTEGDIVRFCNSHL